MMTGMDARRALALLLLAELGCRPDAAQAPIDPVPVVDAPPATPADEPPLGPEVVHLGGAVDAPGGIALAYFAVLRRGSDGRYKGTLDIPMQSVRGVALEDIEVDDVHLAFSLASVKARWTAKVEVDGELACSFEQMGVSLPCRMQPMTPEAFAAATSAPKRPQTPKPPFPYDAIEVDYDSAAAGVHLAGTLTIPPGEGPHPVALLITGSGAQDRDETILGHKPFAVLADHLARHEIAALRVDDRGIGGSSRGEDDATSADLAEDVRAGVEFLARQPRIDPKRIGLIGHSEGGLIAPMVASRSKEVAFIVLLAAPGVPGSDLIVEQVGALAEASGASEEEATEARALQREIVDLVVADDDPAAAMAKVRQLLVSRGSPDGPQIEAQLAALGSPWYRFFLRHDPRPDLRKVRCPVLVIGGELDRQVVAEQNLPELEKALKKAGNRRVTVRRLEGLNHLLQPAQTGAFDEYEKIEVTMAPEALDLIAEWIAAEVPAPAGARKK
jgi:uncharacterized protein